MNTQKLTMLEMSEDQIRLAERAAKRLGYTQTAYTSTSALLGLFCLPENPEYSRGPVCAGCFVQTLELGLLFVQDLEDLRLDALNEIQRKAHMQRQPVTA